MAKVKTASRGRVNVHEMTAYRRAYGGDLGFMDYFKMVFVPGIFIGFVATIVLYTPIISLGFAIAGWLYGFFFLMPSLIKKEYETISFAQRNKFINNMTQIMTDENKTVGMSIGTAKIRAEGEFKDDLTRLEAKLFGSDVPGIQDAIDEMSEKYLHDPIFSQYIEQIETAAIEGNTNIETLKDIKGYHNQMKDKQEDYENQKQGHLSDMKTMLFTMFAFIAALNLAFGFDTFLEAFAHAWAGRIAGMLYLLINSFFIWQFGGYLFDDSVTEARK